MCNSVKNLIQQSRMDTSLKSIISKGKVSRSGSMQSDRRNSAEKIPATKMSEQSPKKSEQNRNQEPKQNGYLKI